jgi:Domain of unknown function (DUF4062)
MNIKFQVFVSSTYKDLVEERQEVMQALLELDCIPVGMELFPAADDDQWTLIKRLIDDCDYYILIVGGRYGSINATGISYTQMEYEYALSKGIPIISFLHKDPEKIEIGKSEKDPTLKLRLDEFKELVQQKMCRFWDSPKDLGSQVSRSLVRLIKDKPMPGWVKADLLPSEESTKEILNLKNQIDLLKEQLLNSITQIPKNIDDLEQGDDKFLLEFTFKYWNGSYESENVDMYLTYNQIFFLVSPSMVDESDEMSLKQSINRHCKSILIKSKLAKYVNSEISGFSILDSNFQTLKIQYRALGLITQSIKKRSIKDTGTYWTLTPFGDNLMVKLRAIKKTI